MKDVVSIALCCNDPDNGNFTGRFDAVDIGSEILKLDNKYYPPKAPRLRYEMKSQGTQSGWGASPVEGRIKVARRYFPVIGYKSWWGNWCWDCVLLEPEVALRFLNYLKELDYFQPEYGLTVFFDTFNDPKARFNEKHLPELCESGYQAP